MLDDGDLSRLLEQVSDAFLHGESGFQVWRLEQREIAERLMGPTTEDSGAAIFRYAEFRDLLTAPRPAACLRRLEERTQFLLEHVAQECARARRIQHALVDLLDFVDPDCRWIQADRRARYEAHAAVPNRAARGLRKKRRAALGALAGRAVRPQLHGWVPPVEGRGPSLTLDGFKPGADHFV